MGSDDPEGLFGSGAESDDDPAPAQQPADQNESLEDDVEDQQPNAEKGLFGSDSDDEQAKAAPAQADRGNQRQSSDDDEDGDRGGGWRGRRKQAQPLGPPMDVEAPLLPVPATNSVHLMRTTNIVGIQPRAFDPATHEREEESFEDDAGRARVKLASNAMIRWRLRRLPDGREVPESNARFVRWEDGSMQLLLGHEVLDVAQQDVRANNQYLFCLAGLIQGQCPLSSKLALRPASLDSGLHRRLREAVDRRHVKTNKVASAGGLQNPELEQARREKAEEEKIRSREQLAKKQDRVLARPYGGGGGRSKPSRLSDKYLEEDQEWEGDREYDYDDGLTADQRARLSMARTRPALDEQAEAEAGRRLQAAKRGGTRSDDRGPGAAKRRRTAMSEEEEEEDDDEEDGDYDDDEPDYESSGGDEDDGDEEEAPVPPARGGKIKPAPPPPDLKASKPKQRRGVVLSDDDE